MHRSWVIGAALAFTLSCGDDSNDSSDNGDGTDAADSGDMDAGSGADDGGTGGGDQTGDDGGTGGSDEQPGADDSGTGGADAGQLESFSALYDDIIAGSDGERSCFRSTCHNSDEHASRLNLSTRDTAYEQLVEVEASGSQCGSSNLTRVVPGDADASLLVQKLEEKAGGDDVCGEGMPAIGQALSEAQIARFRAWIDQGALDN